jgi:hypothetical protein
MNLSLSTAHVSSFSCRSGRHARCHSPVFFLVPIFDRAVFACRYSRESHLDPPRHWMWCPMSARETVRKVSREVTCLSVRIRSPVPPMLEDNVGEPCSNDVQKIITNAAASLSESGRPYHRYRSVCRTCQTVANSCQELMSGANTAVGGGGARG